VASIVIPARGGYISLDGEPGGGTTFELLLPRMAGVAPDVEPAPLPAKQGGSERILLVEDEEVVRQLTRDLLAREGYDVVVAAEGEEALELAREQTFDLVITDMVMPNLSGKIVAARLLEQRPDLPIIFISGYAHDVLGGGLGATEAFLQKPFSAQELWAAVRASLDRAA
jgi:CheY-like chemotaxis protein